MRIKRVFDIEQHILRGGTYVSIALKYIIQSFKLHKNPFKTKLKAKVTT